MRVSDFFGKYVHKHHKDVISLSYDESCPICWGRQEYDGKYRKMFKDKQQDVNHHVKRYCQTKQFVIDHIDGAKVNEGKITDEAELK